MICVTSSNSGRVETDIDIAVFACANNCYAGCAGHVRALHLTYGLPIQNLHWLTTTVSSVCDGSMISALVQVSPLELLSTRVLCEPSDKLAVSMHGSYEDVYRCGICRAPFLMLPRGRNLSEFGVKFADFSVSVVVNLIPNSASGEDLRQRLFYQYISAT